MKGNFCKIFLSYVIVIDIPNRVADTNTNIQLLPDPRGSGLHLAFQFSYADRVTDQDSFGKTGQRDKGTKKKGQHRYIGTKGQQRNKGTKELGNYLGTWELWN